MPADRAGREHLQLEDRGSCECRPERYCPVHRYRWEYEQDEKLAHRELDRLGAPRVAAPFPHDAILSIAGRIARLSALPKSDDGGTTV